MDQSLHTLFEDYEGSIVDDAHHLAFDPFSNRVFFGDQNPRIFESLFVPEGDPFPFAVEPKHDNIDLVADLEVLAGVPHPTPRDIGDVEQPVETSQVHEDTVVGQVLNRTADQFTLFEVGHGLVFVLSLFLLEDRLARQHHIRATPVKGDDLGFNLLIEIVL